MITVKQLEEARKQSGLKKSEVVRRLKLPHQNNYTNWIRRGSISKRYLEAAQSLYDELMGISSADSLLHGLPCDEMGVVEEALAQDIINDLPNMNAEGLIALRNLARDLSSPDK